MNLSPGDVFYVPDDRRYVVVGNVVFKGNSIITITSERLELYHSMYFQWFYNVSRGSRPDGLKRCNFIGNLDINMDTIIEMYRNGTDDSAALADDMLSRAVNELKNSQPGNADKNDSTYNYLYF